MTEEEIKNELRVLYAERADINRRIDGHQSHLDIVGRTPL